MIGLPAAFVSSVLARPHRHITCNMTISHTTCNMTVTCMFRSDLLQTYARTLDMATNSLKVSRGFCSGIALAFRD